MAAAAFSYDVVLSGIIHGNYACSDYAGACGSCMRFYKTAMEKDWQCAFELSAQCNSGTGLSGTSVTGEE